jgi:hypothetical protein
MGYCPAMVGLSIRKLRGSLHFSAVVETIEDF